MAGINSSICGVAVHPTEPLLAIAGHDGFVMLWNYERQDEPKRNYDRVPIDKSGSAHIFHSIEFVPDGTEILIGRRDCKIDVMDSATAGFKHFNVQPATSVDTDGKDAIKQIVCTEDSKMFACWDSSNYVSLFRRMATLADANKVEWQFITKMKTHEVGICSICFGDGLDEDGNLYHRLFSTGLDRRVFEYEVNNVQKKAKMEILRYFPVEQEALPSCCLWYPSKENKEGLLMTTNDQYKVKLWNPSAQSSRRTCLGPTYGGKITKMKKLQVAD